MDVADGVSVVDQVLCCGWRDRDTEDRSGVLCSLPTYLPTYLLTDLKRLFLKTGMRELITYCVLMGTGWPEQKKGTGMTRTCNFIANFALLQL